jgi:hypothetical protein
MPAKRLAIYNFGMFRELSAHSANTGFHDRNERNFTAAEASDGFIARSGYAGEPGPESWGVQVYPRFYVERGDEWSPSTLSLWRDPIALMAFTYAGVHSEAMRRARDWFVEPQWPEYVLWWVAADHTPDWAEGVSRLEHLHDFGPNARAFNFRSAFDETGQPMEIDRAAVKQKVLANRGAMNPHPPG